MKIGAAQYSRIRNSALLEILLEAALNQGQRIDHQIVARRFSRDAHRVAQIPVAEDQAPQDDDAVFDGDLDVPIQKISIGMKRGLDPFLKLLIGGAAEGLRRSGRDAAAYERTQQRANTPSLQMG